MTPTHHPAAGEHRRTAEEHRRTAEEHRRTAEEHRQITRASTGPSPTTARDGRAAP